MHAIETYSGASLELFVVRDPILAKFELKDSRCSRDSSSTLTPIIGEANRMRKIRVSSGA